MLNKFFQTGLLIVVVSGIGIATAAGDLDNISNYREYTETYSSAGQPTAKQLEAIAANGFERVIYLAFTNQASSLPNEDYLAKQLGMEYVHIPVDWETPAKNDFDLFAAVLKQQPEKKTLVHCQVNFRASTFSFLYRVLYRDVPVEDAKEDMNSVWSPNETWQNLIFEVLEDNGVSPHCDVCDWDIAESN